MIKHGLKEYLAYTSSIGRPNGKEIRKFDDLSPEIGITRPTGSEADKKMRDYVVSIMNDIGLEVKIDGVGNIFGRWSGMSDETIMIGSHIDSVINGGHLDGALGVLSALNAVREMKTAGFRNNKSIEVVVFTGEEGSSFPEVCLGSKVLVGKLSLDAAYKMKNKEGKTLLEVLSNIGYKGSYNRRLENVTHYIELHIEQGPIMFDQRADIGVVENIAGISWINARIYGEQAHAGTFPMDRRADPSIPAANVVLYVNKVANEIVGSKSKDSVRATVGKIASFPGLPNVIPAYVDLGIDVRGINKETFEWLTESIQQYVMKMINNKGIQPKIISTSISYPVEMNEQIRMIIEAEGIRNGYKTIRINSWATHDAAEMATKVKTGMIFVPSKDGISHSPLEWTELDNCEKGAKVLRQTIEKLAGGE
ncbi:MAG: M20 family metallo-hydrolase [Nitrososphaeria archaeon]